MMNKWELQYQGWKVHILLLNIPQTFCDNTACLPFTPCRCLNYTGACNDQWLTVVNIYGHMDLTQQRRISIHWKLDAVKIYSRGSHAHIFFIEFVIKV